MDRARILEELRKLAPELRSSGVASLSLFGSVARGDRHEDSDLDLAIKIEAGFSKGGFDYFGKIVQLKESLSERLGREVDLVVEPVRSPRFQKQIERDRLLAL